MNTEFKETIGKFLEESNELRKRQAHIEADAKVFNEKLTGYLKEQGLPETWSIPELISLAVRKCDA